MSSPLPSVIFWFRSDLRLHDQVALQEALRRATASGGWVLPVFVHDTALHVNTAWGFGRTHTRRRRWLQSALLDLREQLKALGVTLWEAEGQPDVLLRELVQRLGNPTVVCEEIAAPYEQAAVQRLRDGGVSVVTVWQSTLLSVQDLPFTPAEVPDTFTRFRQAVESRHIDAPAPLSAMTEWPIAPEVLDAERWHHGDSSERSHQSEWLGDQRSSLPNRGELMHGGERAALAHVRQYCDRGLPHTYKATRNALMGVDHSSKWSPWLATGALSARQAWASVRNFEQAHGATESTYWLWFELLWRDHFRWMHLKHGRKLYRAGGLTDKHCTTHDPDALLHWCEGRTGHALIDAGMRELALTGYLSNRMRQIVASYLVHDLGCDWRAGAAWFEAQLIDYDVYSNHGNWLYVAGCGTDPRGGRRFNPDKQADEHDPQGAYRRLWLEAV